ncbi:hypothetical protein DL93DRAFT_2230036 [Clavulina sp. PMI_390]|nr:hypothetical protein DL93DRAFT_2230036 [Clavulina sp. PMI_390]
MSEPNTGNACSRCRIQKMKCDRAKPHCSRCTHLQKECSYPTGVTKRSRRPATEILQERVLELELLLHRATLPSTYNLALASEKLLQRTRRLGRMPSPRPQFEMADSPSVTSDPAISEAQQQDAEALSAGDMIEDPHAVQKFIVEELHSHDWTQMDELRPSLSLHLINLFLPHRSHYYFLKDVSWFKTCLTLPPSHPNSIHPCLLNACYLGACASNGGEFLTPFKPHFLRRTRHFLEHSLTFADRITDFLWASIILAVFFARERRLVECLAAVEGLGRMALACGLDFPGHSVERYGSPYTINYLLPPPKDDAETDDRIRLIYSIYVGGQAYTLIYGYRPMISYDDVWPPPILKEVAALGDQGSEASMSSRELGRSALHFMVLVSNTFERAMKFARFVLANNSCDLEEEYLAIESQIRMQQASLPPLHDLHKPPLSGVPDASSSDIALGHFELYGIGLILHSSWVTRRAESRAKMLECVQGLVDISTHVRNLKQSHLSLLNIFHIVNAIRMIARELRASGMKGNAALSLGYCHSIELLLDFLDDVIITLPAWGSYSFPSNSTRSATDDTASPPVEAPVAVRDALTVAAGSLST